MEKLRIKKYSEYFNINYIDMEIILTKSKGILTINELSNLLNIPYSTFYQNSVVYNVFDYRKSNSTILIDITGKKFRKWYKRYVGKKKPLPVCKFDGCEEKVNKRNGIFCSREHFVQYSKENNLYENIGHLGKNKGRKTPKDRSLAAFLIRSEAIKKGKLK